MPRMTVVRRDRSSNVVLWVVLVIIVVVALWWLFFRGAEPAGTPAASNGAPIEMPSEPNAKTTAPDVTLEPAPSAT
jgi:hypothetical protein